MIIKEMANEKQRPSQSKEKWLVEKLKENPELMEKFETVFKITESTDEPKQTADDVEELLLNPSLLGWVRLWVVISQPE